MYHVHVDLLQCMCSQHRFSTGELERSLEFLVQRSPSVALSSTQAGSSSNLPQLQRAVLALFYLTLSESERYYNSEVLA